ncbi:Hypothetical predicted protein, partial [Mytilus galloprovincialis]
IITPQNDEKPFEGSKKFWSFVKHKRKEKIGITSLMKEGKLFTEPADKANILNAQFQSAFSEKSTFTKDQFISSKRMKTKKTLPTIKNITITTEGIDKLLKNLNPNKSPGPDGISPRILKELHSETAPLLQLLFSKSLDTGVVPK